MEEKGLGLNSWTGGWLVVQQDGPGAAVPTRGFGAEDEDIPMPPAPRSQERTPRQAKASTGKGGLCSVIDCNLLQKSGSSRCRPHTNTVKCMVRCAETKEFRASMSHEI